MDRGVTHSSGVPVVAIHVVKPEGGVKLGEGPVVGGEVLDPYGDTGVSHIVLKSDVIAVAMAKKLASDDAWKSAIIAIWYKKTVVRLPTTLIPLWARGEKGMCNFESKIRITKILSNCPIESYLRLLSGYLGFLKYCMDMNCKDIMSISDIYTLDFQ